jgi:hypothetical protein
MIASYKCQREGNSPVATCTLNMNLRWPGKERLIPGLPGDPHKESVIILYCFCYASQVHCPKLGTLHQ